MRNVDHSASLRIRTLLIMLLENTLNLLKNGMLAFFNYGRIGLAHVDCHILLFPFVTIYRSTVMQFDLFRQASFSFVFFVIASHIGSFRMFRFILKLSTFSMIFILLACFLLRLRSFLAVEESIRQSHNWAAFSYVHSCLKKLSK